MQARFLRYQPLCLISSEDLHQQLIDRTVGLFYPKPKEIPA